MNARRLILLFFGLTLLLMSVRRLRVYRLKERHALVFLFTGLPFLVLAVQENAIGYIAHRLNIEYQTLSLMCVVAFLLLMVFELLTIVSLQDRKISTLAQIVGIMMEKHGMSDRGVNGPETPARTLEEKAADLKETSKLLDDSEAADKSVIQYVKH